MAINAQGLQGRWNELKGEVKQRWPHLTDADLEWTDGDIGQLVARLQERAGEPREVIENYLDDLTHDGAAGLSGAVDAVGRAASRAANRLREGRSHLAEAACGRCETARAMMSRNPAVWVAGAFGVGFLTGLVAGRSKGPGRRQPIARRYF